VTWWKGLSLFIRGSGDSQEIFTEGGTNTATTTLNPMTFDARMYIFTLKKAKSFGAHTGMHFLARAHRLIGTHTTFTWLKD
jgi:hypothetical protein